MKTSALGYTSKKFALIHGVGPSNPGSGTKSYDSISENSFEKEPFPAEGSTYAQFPYLPFTLPTRYSAYSGSV
ncbi:hypothetical protein YP6_00201 [Escherichia phage YP-6]|uniref:Uncharacterized protein n=1 Tax=Escherichia phage YP-6 TaxID=3020453 RepID=A0AAE9ZRW5_9CAUD|nr:hypothetical protein YP6_00201 [Escherichia phage YP-6]